MNKHLIFFIHGMGKHTAGWSDSAWKAFNDAYDKYDELKGHPFDDRFERVEVLYDDVFESYRNRWRDDSAELIKLIQTTSDATPNIVQQIISLGSTLGKETFFNTHLLDVVMYRFLSLVRTPVKVKVAKQIAQKLNAVSKNGLVEWSVVCHSLGTSVGHDTLHYMFQEGESDIDVLSRKNFAPHTGLFVANVSRVLETAPDVYTSLVRPSWQRKTGIFEFYLNVNHTLDPFPRPRPFEPTFDWIDSETRKKKFASYQDIRISEITKPNIHDLDHFLANPSVHIPLIRTLFGLRNIILAKTESKAVEDYHQYAKNLKYTAIRDQLKGLIDHEGPSIEGLLNAAVVYNSIVKWGQP